VAKSSIFSALLLFFYLFTYNLNSGKYRHLHFQIDLLPDPIPMMNRRKDSDVEMESDRILARADPEKQELLLSENEPDPMDGEQTWSVYQRIFYKNRPGACTIKLFTAYPKVEYLKGASLG
jgi:hypothetical protein